MTVPSSGAAAGAEGAHDKGTMPGSGDVVGAEGAHADPTVPDSGAVAEARWRANITTTITLMHGILS